MSSCPPLSFIFLNSSDIGDLMTPTCCCIVLLLSSYPKSVWKVSSRLEYHANQLSHFDATWQLTSGTLLRMRKQTHSRGVNQSPMSFNWVSRVYCMSVAFTANNYRILIETWAAEIVQTIKKASRDDAVSEAHRIFVSMLQTWPRSRLKRFTSWKVIHK